MPAKSFIVRRSAAKQLSKLPFNIHGKVILAFRTLQSYPTMGSKLKGSLSDLYKFRVGDYRIIYSFDSKQSLVVILKIEHRQGVYK